MDIVIKALALVGGLCVVCALASLALERITNCFDEWEEE